MLRRSMAIQCALPALAVADPQPSLLGLFAERIVERNDKLRSLDPRIPIVAAECYLGAKDAVNGCASNLPGKDASIWRDTFSAERPLTLEWLVALACMPYAEARAAVRAVLAILSRVVGDQPARGTLAERVADLTQAAAAVAAELIKRQADGLDDADRAVLARKIQEADEQLEAARALVRSGR